MDEVFIAIAAFKAPVSPSDGEDVVAAGIGDDHASLPEEGFRG